MNPFSRHSRAGGSPVFTRLAPLLPLLAAPAGAATIETLTVRHDGPRYQVEMSVQLRAPPAAAYAAFADPANLARINPAVQQATVLQRGGDGQARIYTEVHVCALLYCKLLRQTQDMRYAPRPDGGELSADVVAEGSDFRYGHARWQFQPDGAATRLHFQAELEPAFWIPPVVGPWLVERSLREEAERTSAGIERLARPPADESKPSVRSE